MRRLPGLLLGAAAVTVAAAATIPAPAAAAPGRVSSPPAAAAAGVTATTAATMTAGAAAAASSVPAGVQGMDVSSHQGNVSWSQAYRDGARFAYVKATESVTYRNPYYAQQYQGSRQAGMVRGAYHFALPHKSGGAAQADYFVAGGGGWTADGWTLPGVLDIEFNPYQSSNGLDICYDLSPAAMVSWIRAFSDRYLALTGRRPAIYTNTYWWQTCTGGSAAFGDHPLWLARYSSAVGALPAGWTRHAIWQYADSGVLPGDQNVFNGTHEQLKLLAGGGTTAAPVQAPAKAPAGTAAKRPVRTATRVTSVNAWPEPVRKGRTITVSGTLRQAAGTRRGIAREPVVIRFKARGSRTWATMGTVTTTSGGAFSRRFKAVRDGSWQVLYRGDSLRLASSGGSDYVDVRTWW
ncbi:lysozyme [Planomonospora corallina]|uniref:Lysozyme n=1 Tax=Planomonospora corallina TaxID=1806052 RepID=A0ABV8ICN6_9ACTN